MLRCVTLNNETLYASNCEEKSTRKLSREKDIFCPNCQNVVMFKKGRVMKAHFAHHTSDCVVTNYEPETDSHIKGKQILYDWLREKYPSAEVEFEVYIPQTKQIADVYVRHTDEEMAGLTWAFEFQHSPLSSTEWEIRHNLYQSEGIQDFWILDKAKYLKLSKAQGITDARLRKELEKTIFNETGLCYFLDLESSELTIDFAFITSTERRVINRMKVDTDYIYHSPILHSSHMDKVRIRINEKFKHGVLIFDEIEGRMNDRLIWILQSLIRKQELQLELELQERAIEKKKFAESIHEKEVADKVWLFMKANREALINDVRYLTEQDFFDKYNESIYKSLQNLQDFITIKESDDLIKKLLSKVTYESEIYRLPFLIEQKSLSLHEFLVIKNQEKISLVEFVYVTYREVLEKLASMRPYYIKNELRKIKSSLASWETNPTAIDYAIQYHELKSIGEIKDYMAQIKEKIIDYNPFSDL